MTVVSDWYSDPGSVLAELQREHRERAGRPTIEGYEDFEELHRGGQGIVYSATQRSTRQRVAIKVLREGMYASASERRRFEREIEVVATMRHANIVRVYDSGVSRDGRLYCVMEYIEGAPLDDYVRKAGKRHGGAGPAVDETLKLLTKICDAVNYAHQRGVLHRDLKPSNIRVDDSGDPHVLDFGLAKPLRAEGGRENSGPELSVAGQFMGSLPWASPEQVRGEALDIRSDVYSLGVVSYQLLVGRFPYPVVGNIRDVSNSILETEPGRPHGALGADVDTILLKCLAKAPAQRYQTVGDLGRDIRHYLAGEPIEARRDSTLYTLQKALRRHRLAAIAALVVMAAVVLGLVISLIFWRAAVRARDRAIAAEAEAKARYNDVREMATAFIYDFEEQVRPLAGSTPARKFIVSRGLAYLDRLLAQGGDDPELLKSAAGAYLKIGDVQGGLGHSNLGDTPGAVASYDKALAVATKWNSLQSSSPESRASIGDSTERQANMMQLSGKTEEAMLHYRKAIDVFEGLSAADPTNTLWARRRAAILTKIAGIQTTRGENRAAFDTFSQALEIIAKYAAANPTDEKLQRDLAVNHMKLGQRLHAAQELETAMSHYRTARVSFEKQVAAHPESASDLRYLSICWDLMANVAVEQEKLDDALASFTKSLEIAEELAAADPKNAQAQRDLSVGCNSIGDIHLRLNRPERAMEQYTRALKIAETLRANDPANVYYQRDVAYGQRKIAGIMAEQKHYSEAAAGYRQAIEILAALAVADTTDAASRAQYADAEQNLGDVLKQMAGANESTAESFKQLTGARDAYRRALDTLNELNKTGKLDPSDQKQIEPIARKIAECDALISKQGSVE